MISEGFARDSHKKLLKRHFGEFWDVLQHEIINNKSFNGVCFTASWAIGYLARDHDANSYLILTLNPGGGDSVQMAIRGRDTNMGLIFGKFGMWMTPFFLVKSGISMGHFVKIFEK
jgi:hypothetical protein